jgi:hypothetical protein
MNGYKDLTTNIENSRNSLRRIACNDDQEFSKDSIVNMMVKFVKTVNAMDETILVPCRLMDLQVGDTTDTIATSTKTNHSHHHHGKKKSSKTVLDDLNSADLFTLYNKLNEFKVALLWGNTGCDDKVDKEDKDCKSSVHQQQQQQSTELTVPETQSKEQSKKGHVRTPSTVSMTSSNSTSTISDSESEISNENDSGIESENTIDNDKSTELANQCRTHLLGLHKCLEKMTEAALYLTARYQNDIGPV